MSLHALKPYPVAAYHRNLAVVSAHGAHRGTEGLPSTVHGGRSRIPVERVIEGEVLEPVFRTGKGSGNQFENRLLLFGSAARFEARRPNAAALAAYQENVRVAVARDATARFVNVFA